MMNEFRVTIVRVRKPAQRDLNKELQWFSNTLGLFTERDKEKSCFRIFVELIKAARFGKPMSSDEIAFRTNLSRGTIIHHINRLIESGLVVPYDGKYVLRVENLEELVHEVRRDTMRTFDDLQKVAQELDEQLGLRRPRNPKVISD